MFRRSFGVLLGLIPAHAGKTTGEGAIRGANGAHPRSRGENDSPRSATSCEAGSSPLTRGKHVVPDQVGEVRRLIPAHAGKTREGKIAVLALGAHPRSRGENPPRGHPYMLDRGSSPLTRGKHLRRALPEQRNGLIPAHAGKTYPKCPCPIGGRAHPRSRGENSFVALIVIVPPGSSPLTRGKRRPHGGHGHEGGLIPAHAGKTFFGNRLVQGKGAHPRSRGENRGSGPRRDSASGSSPLTRGKLGSGPLRLYSPRLIPAHAGKTSRPRASW